jgi:hypothetical protein
MKWGRETAKAPRTESVTYGMRGKTMEKSQPTRRWEGRMDRVFLSRWWACIGDSGTTVGSRVVKTGDS